MDDIEFNALTFRAINQLLDIVFLYIVPVFMILLLSASIFEMRKKYPHEIYAIWYIFFLFFLIFFALYYAAALKHQEITELMGPSFVSALEGVIKTLTTVQDELIFVGAIVYLGIVPQLLTYVFSGIAGAATAPLYIKQIGLAAVWSIIKFLAGLGGIFLSHPVAQLWWHQAISPEEIAKGSTAIALAFGIAAVQHRFFDNGFEIGLIPGLRVGVQAPWLKHIHHCFTRHRPPVVNEGTVDTRKDAAILAATVAGTVAVAALRDPAADVPTVASRAIQSFVAIEEETRAKTEVETVVVQQDVQKEWVLSFWLFSLHFRGPIVAWIDKSKNKKET
jgi:hypothetical protein